MLKQMSSLLSFILLQMMFCLSKGSVFNIFWRVAFVHCSIANPLTRRWCIVGLTDDEKDELFEEYVNQSAYFRFLQERILDPRPGYHRRCLFYNIDSVHIEVQNSSDMWYQRSVFSYKGYHCIGTVL